MPAFFLVGLVAVTLIGMLPAAGTAQEINPIARKLPPPGLEISVEQLEPLQAKADALRKTIADSLPAILRLGRGKLLTDAVIYLNAAQSAIDNGEFYDRRDVERAEKLLEHGRQRVDELRTDNPSWVKQRGTLVRGFLSQLDNSVQPYGLVIPEKLDLQKKVPLYVWLHGRGDKMTELSFIVGREGKPGEIHPDNAIVLHPFGRYCNGFKFAGEVDVLEAIDAVWANYPIDPERIVLCGFSMGGAGAWHLGAHYAEHWCAVSPGAGFAETAGYQNLKPEVYPVWYEQKLWGLYDVPDYVLNLFNIPVVAYSGELDKQIQSARVMEEAYHREGRELTHLIGPGVAHKYNPDTLAELLRRLDGFAAQGRPANPQQVTIETRTLRYNSYGPVKILGLGRHWEDARVVLDATAGQITTRNVTALEIRWPEGKEPRKAFDINGQKIMADGILELQGDRWQSVEEYPPTGSRRKIHGLQGPIDDAFMEPFLVVTPTGQSSHPQVERWVQFELAHFLDRWKRLFRGTPRVKRDTEVTDQDLKDYNLIVWGDPESNQVLARAAGKLPIAWGQEEITVSDQRFAAAGHALVMIYPNPLEPSHYLVVNSGPTFREGHDASNSVQTPKLPDWAVVDLSVPPDALGPGRIVAANFFNEFWALNATKPQK